MHEFQIHNRKYLKDRRRELRNDPTAAEYILWQVLKGSKIEGRKFRRQHSIGNYIVDFYCPAENLILEVDVAIHNLEAVREYDIKRQKYLEQLGFRVLRVQNEDVIKNMHLVIEEINKHFIKR